MPANFCPENDADNGNSDPLDSIFADLSVDEESEGKNPKSHEHLLFIQVPWLLQSPTHGIFIFVLSTEP